MEITTAGSTSSGTVTTYATNFTTGGYITITGTVVPTLARTPEYKVGDIVMLSSVRPRGWNSDGIMDRYLGNVVVITAINGREFSFEGSRSWTFTLDDIVKKFESKQEVDAHMAELAEEQKEKIKNSVYLAEDIYKLAVEVFGEEYVDLQNVSRNKKSCEIIVYFPEIEISNSKGHRHIIKELYVRMTIDTNIGNSLSLAHIHLDGRRGEFSNEEFHSNYGHSHYSSCGVKSWSNFCLGTSDFSMIIHSMKLSISAEDWYLLFFSLKNYVSWESLEGGPYRKMIDISVDTNVNRDRYTDQALALFSNIPSICFTFTDGKMDIIEEHPALYDYYNANSRLKSFESPQISNFPETLARFNRDLGSMNHFAFKGKTIIPTLYEKKRELGSSEEHITKDVCEHFNKILKKELRKYNLSYEYTKNRILHGETFSREVISF